MPERINSAITALQEEEETLLRRKSKLDEQASEIDAALKRVRAALTALGVRVAAKPSGKKGSSKPSPDKVVVREAVMAALQVETLGADALRAEVERQLTERGYSRMGLSLRLKEVLGEEEFTESARGYLLSSSQDANSSKATPVFEEVSVETS